MSKKLFFCENCRIKVEDVTTLQFVEENSDRGFCSESCILEFYRPFMSFFEDEEDDLREKLGLQHEDQYLDITSNKHYLNTCLSSPNEVWSYETDLGQVFYTHILPINQNGENLFFILICSYVEDSPSFVFYRTASSSIDFVNFYRKDDKVEFSEISTESYSNDEQDIDLSNEILEELELKKSQLLANILTARSESDIPLEDFISYDKYLSETIDSADDVFEYDDEEGDRINTFIKSYYVDNISFFYIVLTKQYKVEDEINVLPIIGFPSNDQNVYLEFSRGKKLNSTLKN